MATLVNGLTVFEATVRIPLRGAWVADLEVDGAELLPTEAHAVTLYVQGNPLVGTVVPDRQTVYAGRLHARLVGGANGFGKVLPAKGYRAAPASIVVRDILREAGELLAPSSASLTVMLRHWNRTAAPAGRARDAILEALGYSWRVLPDGTVWVGVDTWPASAAQGETLKAKGTGVRVVSPADGSALILPGEVFDGGKVSSVTYTVRPKAVRAMAWAA